jgi:hypothetical protein
MEKGKESLTQPYVLGPAAEIMSSMTEKNATNSQDSTSSSHNINTNEPTPAQEAQRIEKPEKAFLRSPRSRSLCSSAELTVNACCAPHVPLENTTGKTMGLSKSNRIIVLLVIDSIFFLVELVVGKESCSCHSAGPMLTRVLGYAVHSLALVADSFHMVRSSNQYAGYF